MKYRVMVERCYTEEYEIEAENDEEAYDKGCELFDTIKLSGDEMYTTMVDIKEIEG